MSEHSPILDPRDRPPWVSLQSGGEPWEHRVIRASDGATIASVTGRNGQERHSRALHIVKCVNMHDDLVEMCRIFNAITSAPPSDDVPIHHAIHERTSALLAKAKGEA